MSLVWRTRLKQSLTEVVAVVVHHQLWQLWSNILDEECNDVKVGFHQLLLQEPWPCLWKSQFSDMSFQDIKLLLLCLGFFKLLDYLVKVMLSWVHHHARVRTLRWQRELVATCSVRWCLFSCSWETTWLDLSRQKSVGVFSLLTIRLLLCP